MSFINPFLGVGRLPKVTEDFISDPYGVGYDVTYLAQPEETTTNLTPTGSLLAPINANFDYQNNIAYKFSRNGTALTNVFRYTFPKVIYMKTLNLLYSAHSEGATSTILIEVSPDGVNWETIENYSLTAGNTLTQRLVSALNRKIKVVRFTVTLANVGATDSSFEFHHIEAKSDPYQYS